MDNIFIDKLDNASIGRMIEKMFIAHYNLENGFSGIDAWDKDQPVEIKSCRHVHKNGIFYKNTKRVTQGRFWINAFNHEWLINNDGFYIFVLYGLVENYLSIIDYKKVSCEMVNKFYHENNFKIRWEAIFR